MAKVTVIEASKLTSKSTQTIYRHIKAGKLSKTTEGKLDTAELLRVYGAFKTSDTPNAYQPDSSMLSHESPREAWLISQIEKLQNDIKDLKAESLERERRLMALLEHKASSVGGIFGKLFK